MALADSFLELVLPLDREVLHFLNVDIQFLGLDQFWKTVSQLHKIYWTYILALPFVGYGFYIYRGGLFKVLIVLAITVGIVDQLCYRGIKGMVSRDRPFADSVTGDWVRKVGEAHGPSFPSNHAANTFAGASILGYYFRRRLLFYTFAGIVGLSRVALGVHFPSDVLIGAMVGVFVAFLIKAILLNRFYWFQLKQIVS